jgi:hypothetical protein
MSNQSLSVPLRISVALLVVLVTAGCVTKSDLEKVTREVDAQRKASSSQEQRLRLRLDELQTTTKEKSRVADDTESRIKAIETKLEVMTDEVIREVGTIRKALAEVQTKRHTELEVVEGELRDLKQRMVDFQQEQLAASTNMNRLRSLTATLLRTYQLQFENLRRYLRDVEEAAKELNSSSDSSHKSR